MEKIHYDILEEIDSTSGGLIPKPVIERLDHDNDDIDDALSYLKNNTLVKQKHIDGTNNYRLKPSGIEALYNKELRDSIRNLDSSISDLHAHQKKSSSVETVFTFALITFAYLQIVDPTLGPYIAETILFLGIGWALLIGGLTPFKMTGKRFKQIRKSLGTGEKS